MAWALTDLPEPDSPTIANVRPAARSKESERTALAGGVPESPAAFFERIDGKRIVAALGDVVTTKATADEHSDIGETAGFLIHSGEGECAA